MTKYLDGEWKNVSFVNGVNFTCGYCGTLAGPSTGYQCLINTYSNETAGDLYMCPNCNKPTFIIWDDEIKILEQVPGPMLGNDIEYLEADIESIYNEARRCISVNAYTSAVLSCRKLLMNIAVSKGAAEGDTFYNYVTYLKDNHFIPPGGEGWVDHIRKKGNHATHKLPNSTKEDAEDLLTFAEMLLRFVYEMPGRMSKHV